MAKRCEECDECICIGGGDFICEKEMPPVIVIDEYQPSSKYLWCKKKGGRENGNRT